MKVKVNSCICTWFACSKGAYGHQDA